MEIGEFYLLVAVGVFLASCSQILLKKSAQKDHSSKIAEVLNRNVVFAYGVFLCTVIINTIALGHGVNVKDLPILEALGYIFVPVLSFLFLNEKMAKKDLFAVILIIFGIVVFYL